MKVLIIGANGQLGFDLLHVFGDEAIGVTHADLDVCNEEEVYNYIEKVNPGCVINTAAFHNVEECEKDYYSAFFVNSTGAMHVAAVAHSIGASVVYISTDYVFEGTKKTPYVESDTPGPLNLYGWSKLAGEKQVLEVDRTSLIVRTSGLFGINGSRKGHTFPEFILKSNREGKKLTIVDDQIFSPTYSFDLATAIKALIYGKAKGIYHLSNGGRCSWYEFALATCKIAKVNPMFTAITTEEYNKKAKIKTRRPAFSVLGTERIDAPFLRVWEQALESYLVEMEEYYEI